jgi:hypothetical protein
MRDLIWLSAMQARRVETAFFHYRTMCRGSMIGGSPAASMSPEPG